MKKIIIIILASLLIAGAGAYYFFFMDEETDTNVNTPTNTNLAVNENTNVTAVTNENANVSIGNENTNVKVKDDKEIIRETAFVFAERYGSFSNTNDFEHLTNLKDWMTKAMQTETDAYIASEKAKITGNEDFFAVFTKVISTNVSNLKKSSADCLVQVQRAERDESITTSNYFQNLLLKFSKENDAWKVGSATWQEKTEIK